jgi:hypothetical protein
MNKHVTRTERMSPGVTRFDIPTGEYDSRKRMFVTMSAEMFPGCVSYSPGWQ